MTEKTERHPKGTVINDRYEILHFVGEGGQKRVYEAKDLNLEITKRIVLKEMKRSSSSDMDIAGMQLFEQECIIMMKLSDPSLPKIYDFFIDQGTFYIVQEFIEGDDFDKYIAKGFLPEIEAIEYMMKLVDFLDYLHSHNPPIIFRDLKPANVIINKDKKLYIVDMSGALFPGIGKHAEKVTVKTAGYFPKDAPGGKAGQSTDVYALGVMLYEMLTRYNVIKSTGKLPDIKELRDNISPEIEYLLNKTVFFNYQFRIHSAWELKIEVEEAYRSVKKYKSKTEGDKKGFFTSFYAFFHKFHVKDVKTLGPLVLMFLILGIPIIPYLINFLSNGKDVIMVLPPLFIFIFCAYAFLIYLIWVRSMADNPALSKIYKAFHKRTGIFGGLRPITLLVTVNFFIIAALYLLLIMQIFHRYLKT